MSEIVPQKQCPGCKELLPATSEYFPRRSDRASGLHSRCKKCSNAYRRSQYALEHPVDAIPDGYRRCSKCREVKPATPEFFHRNKPRKGGLYDMCKECRSRRKSPKPVPIPIGHKKCSRCKQIKPATNEYFPKSRHQYDGWNNECKKCTAERAQVNNKEEKKDYNHQYHLTHADKLLPRHRAYHQTHLPQRREARQRRAEYYAEQDRQYRKTHREQYRTYKLNRRSRENSVPGEHTPEEIQEQLKRQKYRCYYASCDFSKFPRTKENGKWKYLFHVEHTIPVSRTEAGPRNDIDYLVLSCEECNLRKGKKLPHEWPEGGRLF